MKARWVIFGVLFLMSVSAEAASTPSDKEEIRLGVISFYNPRVMYMKYQPFIDFMNRKTPCRWELKLARNYEETIRNLRDGKIDIAYLCPMTYIRALHQFKGRCIAKLRTQGIPYFRSMIIVRDDSTILKLEDLRGRSFAFGSEESTSGHLMPRKILKDHGIGVQDFKHYQYLYHHDEVAKAVLRGQVDAGGVRDLTAEKYRPQGLRVLAVSEPIPNFPVVVRQDMNPRLADMIQKVLLTLNPEDPADADIMNSWDEELRDGFMEAKDEEYEVTRKVMEEIFGARAWKGSLTH